MEKRLKKEYSQAEKELKEKFDDYLRRFEIKDKIKRRQLKEGIITARDYKQWKIGQIAIGERWDAMRQAVAEDLANREKIAKSIAEGYMPEVYAINMNYSTYAIENGLNINTSFTLYSREAVEKVMRDNPQLLPPPGKQMRKKIELGQVVKWKKRQVQSVVLQSIIQGESIPNMATRISKTLCTNDRKAAIRYARTATTWAENAGRLDSYTRAQSMGVKLKKMWIAILDNRTRDAHRELDGQTIPVDKPFENSIGKIMCPGDPSANGANLWNCRCTMITQLEGFERDATDLSIRDTSKLNMSYEEWKKGHGKSQDITMPDKIAKIMKMRYSKEYRK